MSMEAPFSPDIFLEKSAEEVRNALQAVHARLASIEVRIAGARALRGWQRKVEISFLKGIGRKEWRRIAEEERRLKAILAEYDSLKARLAEFDTHYPALDWTTKAELRYSTEDTETRKRAARLFNALTGFYSERMRGNGGVFVPDLGDYMSAQKAQAGAGKFSDAYDRMITRVEPVPFPGTGLFELDYRFKRRKVSKRASKLPWPMRDW